MPTGCGVWPAFWIFGPNWPASGEIDIIEGINNQAVNSITLYINPGYVVSNTNSQSGTFLITTDYNSGNANEGYTTRTSNPNNFRAGFNNVGGGTYAIQWASSGFYVWF
jgi:beta-glucanase (GH16 family)